MSESNAESKLATAKTVLSTAASIAATAMVARSIIQDFLPDEFHNYITFGIRNFLSKFSNQLTMVVEEYDGLLQNEIYEAAVTYLATKVSGNTRRLKVIKPEKESNILVKMERNEEVVDYFNGVKINWVLICQKVDAKHFIDPYDGVPGSLKAETRYFELSFHKRHKDFVINSYLPHIVQEFKSLREANRTLKIFTLQDDEYGYHRAGAWTSVNLDHPSTFDTLALEVELKNKILSDLERFVKRKEFYRKVGKAWKRGYLLYGPPGTGKSSLIAAMANYLNFDVYDLELTEIKSNTDLRKLLLATANRSILVVEDIDCTVEFQNRLAQEPGEEENPHKKNKKQVTLSGFLNFIDGLWSSCGDERIIVFTTNHKEKLDPALLRPGRMDVHVHLSYCTPCAFEILVANYLGIEEHLLFEEIEELITNAQVTPAEVAEELMKGTEADKVLEDLIEFLKMTIKEKEEAVAVAKKNQEDASAMAKKNEEDALAKKNQEESSKGEKEQHVIEDMKSNGKDNDEKY